MPSQKCDLYIVTMGEKALDFAVSLANSVRDEGLIAEYDLMNRSLKAQMKYANKIGADFTVVIGDNEIESGKANLKNMATGQQTEIALDEKFAETFSIQSISLELEGEENLFN